MRVTINIPEAVNENLKREAANRGISVSALAAEAIERHLLAERRRALGLKVLSMAGKPGMVATEATRLIEEGRTDDRA